MVNKSVLATRLERMRQYLDILTVVSRYDVKRYSEDPFIYGTAERHLHLAIECLLDIGNHIISDRGYPKPESYADIFRTLSEQGVVPSALYGELSGMAAFRNVLVHDYLRLDRVRVHEIIREKLEPMKQLGAIFAGLL